MITTTQWYTCIGRSTRVSKLACTATLFPSLYLHVCIFFEQFFSFPVRLDDHPGNKHNGGLPKTAPSDNNMKESSLQNS